MRRAAVAARDDLDMTEEEFAGRIGIGQNYLSTMEHGKVGIGAEILLSLSHEFGKSIEWRLVALLTDGQQFGSA